MIITLLVAKMLLGGYWLTLAPVLFLPLGSVFLSPQVLRNPWTWGGPLSTLFTAAGVIFLCTLTLPDAVTVLAGSLAIWILAAASAHQVRRRINKLAHAENRRARRVARTFISDSTRETNPEQI